MPSARDVRRLDEDDVRSRANPRGTRPRSKQRPRHEDASDGMVLAVEASEAESLAADLAAAGETVFTIGTVVEGDKGCTVFGSAEAWSAREAWEAVHIG